MRTEKEMFDLILETAREDERIRSVILVGSRANSECPKDSYQDYDISYHVTDTKPYYNNMKWIEEKFGKPSVLQLPELNSHPLLKPADDGHFVFLMIFEDGNRIDLSIMGEPYVNNGEPAVVLLDKDNAVSFLPDAAHYHITPPNEALFADVCNEFWWCLNNVAKGIARDELPFVMEMFNHYVRDMLNQMVEWHIGLHNQFGVSAGKMGKYFKKYLSERLYRQYELTYCNSEYENIWTSVYTACELFREMAVEVAEHFGFRYNYEEDNNMTAYVNTVKKNIESA